MRQERRLLVAGAVGLALILAAVASDLTGGFWERHALIASIVSNVLVVAVTLAVFNELLERRDRRRWELVAQFVLFAFVQAARATWTGMMEVLELGEVQSGSLEPLLDAAGVARDLPSVSQATRELLLEPQRRMRVQRLCGALSEHASDLIAKWAPVMVNARPYASVLNRHVELAGRLDWLHSALAHLDPGENESPRARALIRSNVATERAQELGSEEALHDQIVAVIRLATELDYEFHQHGVSLASPEWWAQRTAGLVGADDAEAPLGPASG